MNALNPNVIGNEAALVEVRRGHDVTDPISLFSGAGNPELRID
jgi:hypothetical protein